MFYAMFGFSDWSAYLGAAFLIAGVIIFAMEDDILGFDGRDAYALLFTPGVLSACIMMFEAPYAGQEILENGEYRVIYAYQTVLLGLALYIFLMYRKCRTSNFPALLHGTNDRKTCWSYVIAGLITWIFQYMSRVYWCAENPYFIWFSYLVVPVYGLLTGGYGILPKKKSSKD